MAEESLCQRDRGGVITLLIQERNQAFSGPEKQLVQAIAFWQNPLIVTTAQQVSTIQVCCLLECLLQSGSILSLFRLLCMGKRLFKILHIEGPGSARGGPPLQVVLVSVEKMVGIWKSLPQLMQQFAQIGVCLGLG